MLDVDLAELYRVETRTLLQAVKRNSERFPPDFAFQLTSQEFQNLRSQIVISSWGGRRYPPYAFTEHGVAMLSSVLRSPRAIQVNIAIMRAFVRLRETVSLHKELAAHLGQTWNGRLQATMRASGPSSRPFASSWRRRRGCGALLAFMSGRPGRSIG